MILSDTGQEYHEFDLCQGHESPCAFVTKIVAALTITRNNRTSTLGLYTFRNMYDFRKWTLHIDAVS